MTDLEKMEFQLEAAKKEFFAAQTLLVEARTKRDLLALHVKAAKGKAGYSAIGIAQILALVEAQVAPEPAPEPAPAAPPAEPAPAPAPAAPARATAGANGR